jgi:predicted GNAT superfamily acetyltransferase
MSPHRMFIRPATPADFTAILALNAASVAVLAPLDHALLESLHEQAHYHRVVEDGGTVLAFLLVFREGVRYDSPNYLWFCARYPRFLYIDRIVVSASARGRGIGPALYKDLMAVARSSGVDLLCCEYDLEPPNPGSARFHAGFGFHEAGQQRVAGGSKSVSLQVLDLTVHAYSDARDTSGSTP